MDNGHILGFHGDTSVKHANVVARGDAMTMIVQISGGGGFSIKVPMFVFTNKNNKYPIRGLEDSIPRVSYHTSPKS